MQQVDDPPYLTVGTEVSAKYKGAFCEAKVRKVVRNIKCKVAYKQQGLGSGVVSDDQIKGALRVGATVEVKHPERKEYVEATLTKIQDCSQYTVVFDDGDITTLRRSALCLKSGRHFNESETLDQLPLTHPEHFGNPVIGGRRGRRSRHLLPDESSDEEDEPTHHSRSNASDKEENIGKVVCVETSDNKKKNPKENWFPGLVVAPTAQDTVRIRVKDEYLVRSFKDGRYYTVPKKEATEFTRDSVNKSEAAAVSAAIEYMDNDVLPPHWDREALFGTSGSCSDSDQELETDSSDDEPTEEKDHFVAQLYKFMDDRGTPLNKAPSITNRDVDLYRLFRAVQKLHGYNRVTTLNQWKQIALRLGFSPATASITNLVKQAYKKFLFSFEEFNRKLGCTMVPHPKTSRTKGRSLVRASSVQSPKLAEKEKLLTAKEKAASAAAADASAKASSSTAAAAAAAARQESDNTSESSAAESAVLRPSSTKRKAGGGGKVKALVDKFEEKEKEREKEKASSGKGGGESSGSSGGGGSGKKEDASTSSSSSAAAAAAVKKEKPTTGKAKSVEPVIEKRGRKRKDADSVDSKKDEREAAAGSSSVGGAGSTSSSIKPEKQSTSSRKEESGGPPGREGIGGGGNGTGPGTAGGHSVRNVSPAVGVGSGSAVPDFPIEVGDKLKVYYDEQKVTYEAKVIEIAKQEGNLIYLVHYTGWNTRYDEWVRKERIAENLTNSKTKKGKSSANTPTSSSSGGKGPSHGGTPGGTSMPAGDKTPKVAKRSRGNSKGEQSGGGPGGNSTPRSTTPNVGRNKSPATPSNRRPLTRGGSSAATTGSSLSTSAAAAGRRTSNNTDISSSLSVPTDPDNTSDTDSDEPMLKKCTTNSTSSTTSSNSSISISSTSTKVSTTAEAGSSSDAAAISDEFSNGASKGRGGGGVGGVGGGGRDYDLNQPGKSSESETLSEEDSSQSSNKAFSSSPITTMVDSDTAETPLAAGLVLSPKILASPPPSLECEDSSSTEPLISVANKAADAKALLEKGATLSGVKKESIEGLGGDKPTNASSSSASSSATGIGKPPIKTYGTAATIIANSEKMAFCTHGSSGLLGEKKHFSSSTLTPAQNKLLSKEALSIKSLFESTANRMDEKISDVYEFEDEYDDQDTASSAPMGVVGGSAGGAAAAAGATGPRKLVSDVPPAEVVSSLTPSLGGQQADEKRKKPLQRKAMATAAAVDPLDTSNFVSGGYSGSLKRAKKPSPVKSEPMGGVVADSKSPKGPGALRREIKEKEEKDKEQKHPSELELLGSAASVEPLKEKTSPKTTAPVTTSSQAAGLTTAFVQTPAKSDSTFDVLRKSPSFNLVTPGPLGAKEEGTFKSQEELEPKPTPPPLPATTTPGIFTPVISASSGGSGGVSIDRSISSVLYPHGKGPSTSVLLAKAGDESQKEEPTLENCKKYFNDMNFEFDAPNVKKPPSIADKVLKALSQQNQQQQQQQQQQQTIKSEKPDFPKYMPSSMHHHSLPSTPKSLMGSGLLSSPALESGTPMSFASSLHPTIKSESIGSSGGGGNSSATVSYSSPIMAVNHSAKPASMGGNDSGKSSEGMKTEPDDSHLSTPKSAQTFSDAKATNQQPPQTTTSSSTHKLQSLEQIPTSRSNDLTESLRKLDPDPPFIHDDESTDSNDSEHRLIIEDAESQGSAVIVHYESKQPVSCVVSAKKELFEDKPRSAPAASITLEMASAASAAAVAAVADKEKLVLKQDRPGTADNSSSLPLAHGKEDLAKPFAGAAATSADKKSSGGAKQSLLETIIQMNTASRGMSSEEYLMEVLKVHEQQPQSTHRTSSEADTRKDGSGTAAAVHKQQDNGGRGAVTASVITTVAGSNESMASSAQTPNQAQDQDPQSLPPNYGQSQPPAQAPNSESLSLLLCEETIPGSPAPKDHDRLPPSTVGRKVYAETPLVPTSASASFLPPQNIQTATDLKPVPMDLEPPVVTITIGGNTTISSTSQGGGQAGGGTGGSFGSNLQQRTEQQQQQQQQQSLRSKISSGGGESTADTPNSSPRDSVSQDETHDQESLSPMKKRRQRKPSEEPTLKRRRTGGNTSLGSYGFGNNGSNTGCYGGRSQRGLNTSNGMSPERPFPETSGLLMICCFSHSTATDSEDNSDNLAAFHRSSSLVFIGSKTGRPCQYNFLVNFDPSLSNNQRIGIIRKKIQDLRKTYNAIKAELASIDRRRKKLRRRERENKKQAKLNSASAGANN
uniref:Uncharacterized protein n=1 Tax=Anopheles stephensi TaxID=30069 RepID=A0A182XYY1_ANOST